MASAALDLLKTKTKPAPAAPEAAKKTPKVAKAATKPAPEPEPPEDLVEVETVYDVDKMSGKELDTFVAEQEVDVPEQWGDWGVAEKRQYLNEKFAEPSDEAEVAEAPAEEAKPAKGKKAKQAAKEIEEASTPAEPSTAVVPAKKGKKAAKKAISGEILPDDKIAEVVAEIENLDKANALSVAIHLDDDNQFSLFRLGGVLAKIQKQKWYDPYPTFRDYVEQVHGMDYRTATYWTKTYGAMASNGVPWSKVEGIGWTKLSRIASILTLDNVDEWVELCEKHNLSTIEAHIKSLKGGNKELTAEEGAVVVKEVTTMTFKVHADQKEVIRTALDKAKSVSGTEVDTVALEYIASDFLSGTQKPFNLKAHLAAIGLENALEALQDAFPNADISATLNDEDESEAA